MNRTELLAALAWMLFSGSASAQLGLYSLYGHIMGHRFAEQAAVDTVAGRYPGMDTAPQTIVVEQARGPNAGELRDAAIQAAKADRQERVRRILADAYRREFELD